MRKWIKNYVKVGVGKMKAKIYFVIFSNVCSILKPMLCNRNVKKLVYPTLLSSNCSALALKWSSIWKNYKIFHENKA